MLVLGLDYVQSRKGVPPLDRASEKEVWACVVHSKLSISYAYSWCSPFSSGFLEFLVVRHT